MRHLKKLFPELRKLEGRFLHLFLGELWGDVTKKIEDFAIWARLELGKKKCYDDAYYLDLFARGDYPPRLILVA